MMELFVTFLKNDLIFVAKLVAGIVLVVHQLSFRKGIWWRFALCMSLFVLWSVSFGFWIRQHRELILLLSILKYLCVFVLAVGNTLFCYRISLSQALFGVTIGYCLEHMAQRLQVFVWIAFKGVPLLVQRLTELGIAAILDIVFYYFLIRYFVCREGEEKRKNPLLGVLALVVISTDILLSTWGIDLVSKHGNMDMMYLLNIFSILVSVLVLVISLCDIRMKNAEEDQYIVRQLLRNEYTQFKQEQSIRDIINIKCHDLKHQIAMVETKLDSQELRDIKKAIDVYDSSINTGNPALDVVLSNKALLCSQNNIRFTVVADGAALDFIRDSDIYSLFGNILDNAIQSAEKMKTEDNRLITLTVGCNRGFVFIHEENRFEGELVFSEGLPQTGNSDKFYHGFGMLSIRTLVEKYNGDLKITAVSGVFKIDIMFPLPANRKYIQKTQ